MQTQTGTSLPLNERQARVLYQLAQDCSTCRDQQDFERIARTSARELLPHASLIAALGRIDLEHLEIVHLAAVNYPQEGVDALRRTFNICDRPALMHWLRTREPLVLDLACDGGLMSELERENVKALRRGRVAAHGVVDLTARSGSCLIFAGVEAGLSQAAIVATLQLITPHLHQALVAAHLNNGAAVAMHAGLTSTERDVLRLVAAGRTNADIAKARGRSESTVRNQLTVAFRKLGVRNRAEAVRVALNGC